MKHLRLALAAAFAALCAMTTPALAIECSKPPADAMAVIRAVNLEREARGQQPVRLSPQLSRVAQAYACDMARRGYFGHRSPEGGNLKKRVYGAGYQACSAAENLVRGVRTAAAASAAWMGSRDHRENLLWNSVDEAGVGLSGQGAQTKWVLVLARQC